MGAFFLCVFRFFFVVGTFVSIGILLFIICLGQPKAMPLRGWRLTAYKLILNNMARLIALGYGFHIVDWGVEDVDYTEYLGPNYNKKFEGKRVPTQICNHIAFFDCLIWCTVCEEPPSYAIAEFIRHLPIGAIFSDGLQCVYLDRGLD